MGRGTVAMLAGAEQARSQNLGFWASRAAEKFPERSAIIDWADGRERVVTHGQLEARLQRAGAMLSQWRLEPGTRVAIGVGNRAEFIEVFFGAMRAGLVPVPLNLRQGRMHLAHAIADAACGAAIIEPPANQHLPEIADECGVTRRVTVGGSLSGWQDYEALMAEAPASFDAIVPRPGQAAFIAYTSGSTGKPKGVVLTHAGQLWWIETFQQLYPTDPAERSLVAVPLYHKNAMAGVVKTRLAGGASMVLMPKFEPRAFLQNLVNYGCTHATGVPTIYNLALQERDLIASLDFSALRSLTVGSAPVHDTLHRAMEEAFRCPVFQSYGSTEGGPVVMGPPRDERSVPLGSCGVLWPGCEAKLVGKQGEDQCRTGELWLRNPGVTPGYNNLPDVNVDRLRGGWLATGDLFEVDDNGFWYFRGRADDMFDCGGENVFPKEVEELLLTHPAVRDACVVPAPHSSKGQAPVALVVVDPSWSSTEDRLKRFCLEQGPAYAHPRRIVITDALPLNGAGKVDRAAVRDRLAQILQSAPSL